MPNQQLSTKDHADSVRAILEKMKPQLALALPKHLTADRMLRITMTAVQNTPKLLECDRTSLFAAVMTAAQLGLEPDGVLGHAYLVPFQGKVKFIPGYKGYLALARQSGEIASIQAHEVCEQDEFRYAYGLQEDLHHVPADGVSEDELEKMSKQQAAGVPSRGRITHFYAYAKFKDGGHIFEVMTRAQVDAIRDNSEGYKAFKAARIKSTPWDTNYVQMGRKSGIRRIANYLPMSVQRAAALDAAYDAGKDATTDQYGEVVIEGESSDVTTQAEGAGEPQTGASGATKALDQLAHDGKKGKGTKKPKAEGTTIEQKPEPADPAKPAAAEPTEAQVEVPGGGPTLGGLTSAILKATTVDQVNEQLDLSRSLEPEDRKLVQSAAAAKIKALKPASKDGGLFEET